MLDMIADLREFCSPVVWSPMPEGLPEIIQAVSDTDFTRETAETIELIIRVIKHCPDQQQQMCFDWLVREGLHQFIGPASLRSLHLADQDAKARGLDSYLDDFPPGIDKETAEAHGLVPNCRRPFTTDSPENSKLYPHRDD
jgi:hypothetical protein